MNCDLWPKGSKIKQQTSLLLPTLWQFICCLVSAQSSNDEIDRTKVPKEQLKFRFYFPNICTYCVCVAPHKGDQKNCLKFDRYNSHDLMINCSSCYIDHASFSGIGSPKVTKSIRLLTLSGMALESKKNAHLQSHQAAPNTNSISDQFCSVC